MRAIAGRPSTGVVEARGGSPGAGGEPDDAGSPSNAGGEPNGGASEGGAGGTVASVDQGKLVTETIDRWNAIADNRQGDTYHFHWTYDYFPHPTFAAMGNAEGYQEFGIILDDFLTQNFDFLAEYRQFLTPYDYQVAPSPLVVTWDELASDFSTMSYGDIPADVQERLAADAKKMKAYE
jgi:hypothetical protein